MWNLLIFKKKVEFKYDSDVIGVWTIHNVHSLF
jgi:hypothetical protein